MRTAIFHQLRLLVACLLLSIAARPAHTSLDVPRAVAVLAASGDPRPAEAPRTPAVARETGHVSVARAAVARGVRSFVALGRDALAGSARVDAALANDADHGRRPLYLSHRRFLL